MYELDNLLAKAQILVDKQLLSTNTSDLYFRT
jgi:hypothetical protein